MIQASRCSRLANDTKQNPAEMIGGVLFWNVRQEWQTT